MASSRNQRRQPFRIQNYPDIVHISERGRFQVEMAVGEQQSRPPGGARAAVASVSVTGGSTHGAAAHKVANKKSSHPQGRKSRTLPSQGSHRASASQSAVMGASSSAGTSERSRPAVTRQWVSSGNVHSQPHAAMQPSTTTSVPPSSSSAVTSGAGVHGPHQSTAAAAAAAAATAPSSSSPPPATAAATTATVTVSARTQPMASTAASADHSSVSVDMTNSLDQELASLPAADHNEPWLPPYDSRSATPNWDEIRQPSEALPDLLNSHRLPPYVPTPRQNHHRLHGAAPSSNHGRRQRHWRSRNHQRPSPVTDVDLEDKECCSRDCCMDCLTALTTFRWVLITLAMLGVCCVISGIVLGALHMTVGSSFLTLSLMFIGLGVMLVVVVGVGWRCTPPGHEPCHLLFGLGEHASFDARRSRISRPHRDRNQWYGGMLYPEFRYRRPPPSYNTAMQEYQQQLAQAQIQANNNGSDDYSLPRSPPPTYRSRAGTVRPGIPITFPPPRHGDYPASGPPTYRSRADATERHHRPSLILDNRQSDSSGGLDNPGCSVNENSDPGVAAGGPALPAGVENASSTMARVNRVVEYLDDVLQQHGMRATSSSPSQGESVGSSNGANTPVSINDGDAVADGDADSDRVADTPL